MWELRIYDREQFWADNFHLMELVKETQEEPEEDSMFEIEGKIYRWCSKSPKHKVIGIEEIKLNTDPEEEDGEFKCPYCGLVDDDAWELSANEDTVECGSCGSTIEYERHYEVTYTVSPVKIANIVKL
jgi:predicted RNA-binding Zn-ribbon protein involved in translation (DUF1610 family)